MLRDQTSASHCRRDGRVLKIFDWPATRSVYVAIRDEVKRKMTESCSPRLFTFNYLDTAGMDRFALIHRPPKKFTPAEIERPTRANCDSSESPIPGRPPCL